MALYRLVAKVERSLCGLIFGLSGSGDGGVLLDQVLHGALGDPTALQGQEQRVLVARQRLDLLSLLQVSRQRLRDLRRKIKHHLIAALSGNKEGVFLQIHISDVEADAFRHADAGA